MTPTAVRRPEILAPAGSAESFAAALASGADAIYLGLSEGFNARSRSTAFDLQTLPELVLRCHRAGTRLYVTLNTLVFESELADVEQVLRVVIASGVDALIIQDPAVAFLARALSPEVRLHASTQMTISSAEGARFAATLGMQRVVLPRELSTAEVALFTGESPIETEIFVHGALCMAWSGQCLTSEAFSERSANRGQCSQACRMPYQAVVDGRRRELGDQRYLLSPQDLAAHDALPDLLAAGVQSLKIEGRYKGPAYVSTAVDSWRNWRDALVRGVTDADRQQLRRDVERTELTFSRGGSLGFLGGDDHQGLVVATTPKHRGRALGEVREVRARSVLVALDGDASAESWLHPGMGIKFELVGRRDAEHDPENAPGGPLFGLRAVRRGLAELRFGRPGPDLSRVRPGDGVRVTGDPDITRDAERRVAQVPEGRLALSVRVSGKPGEPLRLVARLSGSGGALDAEVVSASLLEKAHSGVGLDATLLRDKLGALGGTPLRLEQLDVTALATGLYVPVSELKQLRRDMVQAVEASLVGNTCRRVTEADVLPEIRARLGAPQSPRQGVPELVVLCRTEEQLEALIQSGLGPGQEVELDWMEMVGLGRAVRRAREAGLKVTLATVRVQKPGEEAYDRRIAGLAPDGVLVRHWGALMHFARARGSQPPTVTSGGDATPLAVHGDFSLNVTNSLTAQHLLGLGLETVTASHDLNQAQLLDLIDAVPRGRIAVTLHHHIATFHNSHCVYAHLLSDGKDFRTCGRPCEAHRIALRDYAGHEHPVVVDVGCRNTVFNAFAQSAAPLVPRLLERGVQRFRLELVWEAAEEVRRTLGAYQKLLAGELTPADALKQAAVHERYGVTTLLRLRRKGG